MKEKIYFLSEHSNHELIHGAVGLADIETILKTMNAIPVSFPHHFNFSARAKVARLAFLIKILFTVRQGSVIIFQHPVYARMNRILLRLLRVRSGVRIICIVTDIDGLKSGNLHLLEHEKKFFKQHQYFIVHNENMLKWMLSFHPSATCTVLGCFDFLAKNVLHRRVKSTHIIFAGNLEKSAFLEQLHTWLEVNPSLHIHLYGPYVTQAMLLHPQVKYNGLHNPYTLPEMLDGSFGLVWDGDGVQEPSGSLGHYMEFINHHKVSLYIVSNLPIIVHESAGSAALVKKLKLGITVKSLFEVEQKIIDLPESEYNMMVENTYRLAKEITAGNNLKNAIKKLLIEAEG